MGTSISKSQNVFGLNFGSNTFWLLLIFVTGGSIHQGERGNKFLLPMLRGYCKCQIHKRLIAFSFDSQLFKWYLVFWFLSGSNVTYDDSMNLRNILWLAPLPDKSSKSWVAPGTLNKVNILLSFTLNFMISYYYYYYYLCPFEILKWYLRYMSLNKVLWW